MLKQNTKTQRIKEKQKKKHKMAGMKNKKKIKPINPKPEIKSVLIIS